MIMILVIINILLLLLIIIIIIRSYSARRAGREAKGAGGGRGKEWKCTMTPVSVKVHGNGYGYVYVYVDVGFESICGYCCSGYSLLVLPVSVNKHSFQVNLCPATQRQKLLSSHCFSDLTANIPMCIIFWRSVFSQTPYDRIVYHVGYLLL